MPKCTLKHKHAATHTHTFANTNFYICLIQYNKQDGDPTWDIEHKLSKLEAVKWAVCITGQNGNFLVWGHQPTLIILFPN